MTTAYKSGTTWTQGILMEMLHGDIPKEERKDMLPWIDSRFGDQDKAALKTQLEGMSDTRILKSHLPLDGLPYFPEVRYIIVCRDPRDVCMSLFNHYSSYSEDMYERMNGERREAPLVGDKMPRCPEDIHVFWREWIGKGWFEGDLEGYPYWPNMGHTASYWPFRHLPNFLFMHYADMLQDHVGAIREIAAFLELELTEDDVERIRSATTFDNMKREGIQADQQQRGHLRHIFKGGASNFFHKGSNDQWRGVLTSEELVAYAETRDKVLSKDCADFLEQGKAAWVAPPTPASAPATAN